METYLEEHLSILLSLLFSSWISSHFFLYSTLARIRALQMEYGSMVQNLDNGRALTPCTESSSSFPPYKTPASYRKCCSESWMNEDHCARIVRSTDFRLKMPHKMLALSILKIQHLADFVDNLREVVKRCEQLSQLKTDSTNVWSLNSLCKLSTWCAALSEKNDKCLQLKWVERTWRPSSRQTGHSSNESE